MHWRAVAGLGLAAYLAVFRPWHRRWGATDEEVARPLPGDDRLAHPSYATTRAVTINARPAEIWPWLSQIGYRRGGLYSYDWLDRFFGFLDRPSADCILPEFQHLAVGDVIPLGAGPTWPVQALEPSRFLQVGRQEQGLGFTWVWALDPIDDRSTRLVSRARCRLPSTPLSIPIILALDPAGFVMERKMLLGIKARAERLAGTNRAHPATSGEAGRIRFTEEASRCHTVRPAAAEAASLPPSRAV